MTRPPFDPPPFDLPPFGPLADGRMAGAVSLRDGPLQARILTLGAGLQDLRLDGTPHSLTLGSAAPAAYAGPLRYFGMIVGPVANRIRNAQAEVAGTTCRFEANEGSTSLHSGADGLHAQIWQIEDLSHNSVTLSCALPDGLGGFPGQRCITAHWTLKGAALSLQITATTDAPTLMNPANHSYWNLSGEPDLGGHVLWVDAAHYLPIDRDTLPLAEPAPVTGRFDLREGQPLDAGAAYDHNWCLADAPRALTPVARLRGGGLEMTLESTAPGLQVYTADGVDSRPFAGHDGQPMGHRAGVALEPQGWPDAPGRSGFPPVLLMPGAPFSQISRWTFRPV